MDRSHAIVATGAFTAGALMSVWLLRHLDRKKYNNQLIRRNIENLQPYRCARDDYSRGTLLDANENSFGPPLSKDMQSNYQDDKLERYPCPYQHELKVAIGHFRQIAPSHIFLGVGSDEAIDLLIRIVCVPAYDSILVTPPTYGMYSVCANINEINVVSVPLTETFQLDMKNMKTAWHKNPSIKIIFLCHPGNPTATLLQKEDILSILKDPVYQGLVVVDEAYIDFADQISLCSWIKQYKRLVVLQTLSKGFGLAGIRLGMAFANPWLIDILNKVKAPYNINKLTQKVAMDALDHLELFFNNIAQVKSEKQRMIQSLRTMPQVIRVLPSDTNFVLFEIPNAFEIYQQMANAGVVIRYRGNLIHLKNCLRATIGTAIENNEMIQQLKHFSSMQK